MIINQKKRILLKIFLIITLIIGQVTSTIIADTLLINEEKIKKDLQYIKQNEYFDINTQTIINSLQAALYFISEKKISNSKIKEYQRIIDNFSCITFKLHQEYKNISYKNLYTDTNLSIDEIKQKLLQLNSQLIDLLEKIKQEQDQEHSINKSLIILPQQQIAAKNSLNNLEKHMPIIVTTHITPLEQAKFIEFQTQYTAKKLKLVELELEQLSSSNRKELSQLHIKLLKKKYDYTDQQLQILKNKLNSLYQKEAKQTIEYTKKILSKQNNILPKSIKKQLNTNHDLSITLVQQANYINKIESKKKEIIAHTLQVRRTLTDLIEQAQWVNKSPALGEILRSQINKLPKLPKFQQLDSNLAKLRAKRLQYEDQISKLDTIIPHSKQDNGFPLTVLQKNTLEKQITIQNNLISTLLNSYDTQILELTKLKVSYTQLKDALQEIQEATHRYLFWVADMHPITISYPIKIYQDLLKFFIEDTCIKQIKSKFFRIYSNQKIFFLIILCMIIISLYCSMYRSYQKFLYQSSLCIGKVNQDSFLLTFYNLWSSILISLPIPILWIIIGYNLSHAYMYPFLILIGEGIYSTTYILCIFIIGAHLASSNGLFIKHFGWPKKEVQQIFSNYYIWSAGIIISLIISLIIFNNYNNREFSPTLGRLSFIILCIYLTYITYKLKYLNLPLYINKYDSSDNIINYILWNIIINAPITAAIFCSLGYFFTAQELLVRLEKSLLIWTISLIIYYIIRRWMFIQRRRIALERAKKKRSMQLAQRKEQNQLNISKLKFNKFITKNENIKKILDLNTISIQSLQLIRSILTLISILFTTLIWSELRFAFSFLNNITLWDVTSTIKGVENIQPITVQTLLIIIIVIFITSQTVRNLPALLELTLLQYLELTPGTEYAITTLSKYMLMLLGILIGFSLIGIEWTKIQWLIAALSVGLGFGLQEIFANFVSGLIILFEKPIRIGDTVTIQNFTGNITRINTRATIITDWDNKEIIIPNKEFITKKFTNWSLSNKIIRIVIKVPAPSQVKTDEMIKILLKIANTPSLSLCQPTPEVYLIDLQQGLPIFEIRIYTTNIKFRTLLRHQINLLIIEYYQNHGLQLPHIPILIQN